ncbi:multidrug resistance-associated protein 4-like [Centruroides sculpturatus]|uniref:multidrug resistance-associated protein 4-like n=1 Tax=Centruroides sculpturatus TaxID=218467 RepID=UPI000C6D11B4|nr:multidrug resistance-associated protein 4-like [Centruroides sculpturatus]
MKKVRMFLYTREISLILGYPISKLFTSLTYLTFVLNGGKLNAEIIFVTMAFSFHIYSKTVKTFSLALNVVAEILVSLKRFQDFLLLEENESNAVKIVDEGANLTESGIWMDNVTAAWKKESEPSLNKISFTMNTGEHFIVVGPVGSGKTSLLMSMLGEIPITFGKASVKGKIAYASQEPWVFNATIKENILFEEKYEDEKYRKILHITALEKDISLFPKGDLTVVGERGVIMSGGQKARINLARALYIDADIFLLDDPLSAVDVPVAKKHIFEKCITEYLKDKICVLVTHQIQYLNSSSKILLLNKGRCELIGNYNEMENLKMFTGKISNQDIAKNSIDLETALLNDDEIIDDSPSIIFDTNNGDQDAENNQTPRDDDEHGEVKISVYKAYVNAGAGVLLKIILLIMVFVSQSFISASDYWIIKWLQDRRIYSQSKKKIEDITSNTTVYNLSEGRNFYQRDEFNVYVYFGFICAVCFTMLLMGSLLLKFFTAASTKLHNNMFRCIIRTPISFLDNNPVGKVLNRFSKDVNNMDDTLPYACYMSITVISLVVGMCVIQAILCPYVLILISVLSILFYAFWAVFSRILKSIKRIEGKCVGWLSPVSRICENKFSTQSVDNLLVIR